MPGTLRDDILAIPGIDNAELEGEGPTLAGVRVRLAFGADPQRVGREVRRVLAVHGMESKLTEVPDPVAPLEPPPPPPIGTVVNLADYEQGERAEIDLTDAAEVSSQRGPSSDMPPVADEPSSSQLEASIHGLDDDASTELPVDQPASDIPQLDEPPFADREAPSVEEDAAPGWELPRAMAWDGHPKNSVASGDAPKQRHVELGNVAVIEGSQGVTVTVSTRLGRTASKTAANTPAGVDQAVVSAVARLLIPDQDTPRLIEVLESSRPDEVIITAVLEVEQGEHVVGSSMLAASRPWAIARATRMALSGRA